MARVKDIDERFDAQLAGFTASTADRTVFNLGRPSSKVRSAGVADREIRLYGSKLVKKMNKHGFTIKEIRGLPKAVRNPLAVFQTDGRENSYAVLTTLRTSSGNFLVALDLGKGGADTDLLMVTSVYGKDDTSVIGWINKGYLRYVDKKKALAYLHLAAPIAAASDKQGLVSAAKVVRNFKNNKFYEKILISG